MRPITPKPKARSLSGHFCAIPCRAVERWHQTLKDRILLENYFLPGELEAQIEAFVDHYKLQRYHESINNVTPANVYFGRDKAILKQRPSRDIATQCPVGQWNGSNERHSKRDASISASTLHIQTNKMSQTLS